MGNQIHKGGEAKKSTNKITTRKSVNVKNSKPAKKENLFAEDKLFENYENTKIYGYRLESDPEDREYYLNCPFCHKLNLDNGINKTLECKFCKKNFDCEEISNLNVKPRVQMQSRLNNQNDLFRSKNIDELHNIVLILDRDKLFEIGNFFDSLNDTIDYDLIMKKILLPYFKIKSRIMKNGMFFKIGEIDFKVIGCSPLNKGIISSKTNIRCINSFSFKTEIKRALMITTIKYDNFDIESLKKEILTSNDVNGLLINKNELSRLKQYEFYIKNCEPSSGILTENTVISFENRDINTISRIKIAIIKFNSPNEKRNYEDYIIQEYFIPFFLSGNKKYVERGDIFTVEDLEMFVLNSYPENGFVSSETNVMLKLGLNKEKCLEKINNADNRFAYSLINGEETMNEFHNHSHNSFNNSNRYSESLSRMRTLDELLLTRLQMARLSIDDNMFENVLINIRHQQRRHNDHYIKILPTLIVDEDYIKKMIANKDEATKKCVVCMENFELKEVLKTLPCCKIIFNEIIVHIFHSNCIDEWLKGNSQCPICKSDIE